MHTKLGVLQIVTLKIQISFAWDILDFLEIPSERRNLASRTITHLKFR